MGSRKKHLGALSPSSGANFRYGSDGDSHIGWEPRKSIVFDETHTTVLVSMGEVLNWKLPPMARVAPDG